MVDEGIPLDDSAIRSFLNDVAQELGDLGPEHSIVIVGGALLALRELRESTIYIDSITHLGNELNAAIASVAKRHGLPRNWLNDSARGFTPATFELSACEVIFQSQRLRVLAAPMKQIFVMKLYRSDAQDFEDMAAIWSQCSFDSPSQAVDLFYEAYPHAPDDEYLEAFVQQIADVATGN